MTLAPNIRSPEMPPARRYLVGAEVGPAIIRVGIFTDSFNLIGKAKLSTKRERGPAAVIERIARCVEYAVDECDLRMDDIRALGVGVPGQVDADAGRALSVASLGWNDVPMRHTLEKLLRVPVCVENHFKLSTLGVYAREIHSAPRRFAALFLGPAIGGGLMIDGELVDAAGALRADRPFWPGSESVFAMMPHEDFRLARIRDLRKAARKGNASVREFVRAIAAKAGEVSAELIQQFAPDVIVLGGGLVDEMKDELVGTMEQAVSSGGKATGGVGPKFIISILGDLAGMTGGAALAEGKLVAVQAVTETR